MKFVSIEKADGIKLGIRTGGGILDVAAALAAEPAEGIPDDMMDVIAGQPGVLEALDAYVRRWQAAREAGDARAADVFVNERTMSFAPSVPRPGKIVCVGLNYRRHAEETNAAIPGSPILFNKFSNALSAHGQEIAIPTDITSQVDYEAELAIVIGREARRIGREEALGCVFGYSAANDLSARDLQMRSSQWLLGKSLDGFCPLGPDLVTADEVPDPNGLDIRCIVNGETRQRSNTSDMIFRCDEIISYISWHMTLSPGDVILTGTPEGVMLGWPEDRRLYLRPGDIVTVEIERLGSLVNRMA
ncbi:fumarylacetoacetate hydrolase family protein [Cohnella sp. 56]|uniref:fumarylacetoacetate hydrolase family protein n=1 Tax=Cohnella sp. 56 TaxID=3113722 RepID=UPI0030E8E4FF